MGQHYTLRALRSVPERTILSSGELDGECSKCLSDLVKRAAKFCLITGGLVNDIFLHNSNVIV